MSNVKKAAPSVEIEIGGKKRKLVFTLRAFSLIEKETGKNTLNGEIFSSISATELIAVTWAALQKHEPGITIEEVGDMLDFTDIRNLTDAIGQAFQEATPEAEKKGQAAAPESSAPTPEVLSQ